MGQRTFDEELELVHQNSYESSRWPLPHPLGDTRLASGKHPSILPRMRADSSYWWRIRLPYQPIPQTYPRCLGCQRSRSQYQHLRCYHCSTDYIHHPWTSNLPCIQVDERLLYIALCFPFKIKCWRIVQKLYTKAETVVPLILKCIVRNRPLDKGEGSRFYIYERRNLLVSIRHWEIAAGTMHAYLSFEATRSLNQHRTRIFGVELINACLVCLCGFSSHDESIIRLSSGQAMKRSVHYQNEFSTYAVIRF